jgi:hypothetical protein
MSSTVSFHRQAMEYLPYFTGVPFCCWGIAADRSEWACMSRNQTSAGIMVLEHAGYFLSGVCVCSSLSVLPREELQRKDAERSGD